MEASLAQRRGAHAIEEAILKNELARWLILGKYGQSLKTLLVGLECMQAMYCSKTFD